MANYVGYGKLVGYSSYVIKEGKKDAGQRVHQYNVLIGESANKDTGLFDKVSIITIREKEQVLKALKPQDVMFELGSYTWDGQERLRYFNVREKA